MNSDGHIKRGDPELLKSLGFHMPLEEHEASKLSMMDESERLGELAKIRHWELWERKAKAMRESINTCGSKCPSIKDRFKERV